MAEYRERSQLLGEFLREAAVLWLALYPLEAYFNKNFNWNHLGFVVLVSGAFVYWGMILEGTEE